MTVVLIAAMGTSTVAQFHRVLRVRGKPEVPDLWLRLLHFRGSDSADHERRANKTAYVEKPIPNANTKVTAGTEAPSNNAHPVVDLDTEESQTGHDISAVWRIAGSVAGQATLVTALLFYFGWARTQAVMGYFGINSAIARLSVNDYILRSLNITIRMLVILGLLTLIFLSGHRWLSTTLASRRHPSMARFAMLACIVPGFLLCIAGVLGFSNWIVYSSQYPVVPVIFAVGVTLVGYGFHIRSFAQPNPQRHKWSARTQAAALVVLDIAFIFWAVAVYADITGQAAAERLASHLGGQPGVTIYSEKSPHRACFLIPSEPNRTRAEFKLAETCNSTTSESCNSWSLLTVWPSKTPWPQMRANFSVSSNSLCTSLARSQRYYRWVR